MSNRRSSTPQVQDSDSQSDSKHFDEESRDYLLSNSRKNQSEDDRESTNDGLDLFTDHQVHLSTSSQWLCLSCMTSGVVFFLLLIEIISIAKLLIIVHFFVLKHKKQTLSYIHTKFEGDKDTSCFSPIYFVGAHVFLPQHRKLLGPEKLMPLKLLGMNSVKLLYHYWGWGGRNQCTIIVSTFHLNTLP